MLRNSSVVSEQLISLVVNSYDLFLVRFFPILMATDFHGSVLQWLQHHRLSWFNGQKELYAYETWWQIVRIWQLNYPKISYALSIFQYIPAPHCTCEWAKHVFHRLSITSTIASPSSYEQLRQDDSDVMCLLSSKQGSFWKAEGTGWEGSKSYIDEEQFRRHLS